MHARPTSLGHELRRLRTDAGFTLRGLARTVGVSAPHLSDVERDRRRPSKPLLKKLVAELNSVGATYADLDRLDTRLEGDLQEWTAANPEVRMLLRRVKESGRPVGEVLKKLERFLEPGSRRKN